MERSTLESTSIGASSRAKGDIVSREHFAASIYAVVCMDACNDATESCRHGWTDLEPVDADSVIGSQARGATSTQGLPCIMGDFLDSGMTAPVGSRDGAGVGPAAKTIGRGLLGCQWGLVPRYAQVSVYSAKTYTAYCSGRGIVAPSQGTSGTLVCCNGIYVKL